MVDLMVERNELFAKFGPLQSEGLMLLNLEAINVLRVKAGLASFTQEQAMTRLEQILEALEPYAWMNGPL